MLHMLVMLVMVAIRRMFKLNTDSIVTRPNLNTGYSVMINSKKCA
jgi:hypothetical protein